MLIDALNSILLADAGVSAIVGTRIYPDAAPQNTPLPFLAWDQPQDQPDHHVGGESGTVTALVSIGCIHTSRRLARTLANAVRLALRDVVGAYSGTTIYGVWKQDAEDAYVPPVNAGDIGTYETDVTFKVAHSE